MILILFLSTLFNGRMLGLGSGYVKRIFLFTSGIESRAEGTLEHQLDWRLDLKQPFHGMEEVVVVGDVKECQVNSTLGRRSMAYSYHDEIRD